MNSKLRALVVSVGTHLSTGFEIDGIVTSVCVDPSPTRCR